MLTPTSIDPRWADSKIARELRALGTLSSFETNPKLCARWHRNIYALFQDYLGGPYDSLRVGSNLDQVCSILGEAIDDWASFERMRFGLAVEVITADANSFLSSLLETISLHPMNGIDPSYENLAQSAGFESLRYYASQSSPHSLCQVGLLGPLMPGLRGAPLKHVASKLWDEKGRGVASEVQGALLGRLMRALALPDDACFHPATRLTWEALAIMNLYFACAFDRRTSAQMIGVLVASEITEPQRAKAQLDGFRRLGVPEDDLEFLSVHAARDSEHALGWLENVVDPLTRSRPDLTSEIALGAFRFLDSITIFHQRICTDLGIDVPSARGVNGSPV